MGMMKLLHNLLIFYRQLVLRKVIIGTVASLIPYFVINKL